jgi:hypothetical protein
MNDARWYYWVDLPWKFHIDQGVTLAQSVLADAESYGVHVQREYGDEMVVDANGWPIVRFYSFDHPERLVKLRDEWIAAVRTKRDRTPNVHGEQCGSEDDLLESDLPFQAMRP